MNRLINEQNNPLAMAILRLQSVEFHLARLPPEVAADFGRARALISQVATVHRAEEWHEDDGPVLWWRVPVREPGNYGTPNDSSWPDVDDGYYTHWMRVSLPPDDVP